LNKRFFKRFSEYKSDIYLVIATFFWGASFLATEYILKQADLLSYMGARYIIATLVLLLFFGKYLKYFSWKAVRGGVVLGLFLFAGSLLLAAGQLYTTPEKSAFIISIQILVVPFAAFFFLKKKPSIYSVFGVIFAFVGMFFITVGSSPLGLLGGWGFGETLTLLAALTWGWHIIFVSKYSQDNNPIFVCIVQVLTAGILSNLAAFLTNSKPIPSTFDAWLPILFIGVCATAGSLALMLIGQQHTPPTRAAVIYSMEPVFAFVIGILIPSWDGTYATCNLPTLVGGAAIVFGVLVSEVGPTFLVYARGLANR